MPKPSDPIFCIGQNAALNELSALGSSITWGAFDALIDDADKGRASRYVVPLWNYHRFGPDGLPDPLSKGLLRNPQDGSLWYQFLRPPEGTKKAQWKAQWRSLAICQRLAVPIIGVLKDRLSKQCALALTFDGGPFIAIEDDLWMQLRPRADVAPEVLARHSERAQHLPLAAQLRRLEHKHTYAEAHGDFDAACLIDARARVLREVIQRRGQPAFRKQLLAAYGGCCAVTGCDAEDALEAAHIIGYLGAATQHVTNGLLLRADIHTLFDLNLLSICPDTLRVVLAPSLHATSYAELEGRYVTLPEGPAEQPNREALRQRQDSMA